jgi:hypothetical protein
MMEQIGAKPRWQYKKMELLNELNHDLEEAVKAKGVKLSDSYTLSMPDIDEGCDPMNVHGWIQNMLDALEKNTALIAEKAVETDSSNLDVLKETAYLFGYRHASEAMSAEDAYTMIDNVVLNGMPCDAVNEITAQSPENVSWHEAMDMHSKYWKDASLYREIRNEVIRGLLAKAPVSYSYGEGNQTLKREGADL